jgi:hypothetical protein
MTHVAALELALRAKFETDVATPNSLTVVYDNAPPQDMKQTWATLEVVHGEAKPVHGGRIGARRFRATGELEVVLYCPAAQGDASLAAIVDDIIDNFTATTIASPLVEFTMPPAPSGGVERVDAWCRRVVRVPFQHDYYQ